MRRRIWLAIAVVATLSAIAGGLVLSSQRSNGASRIPDAVKSASSSASVEVPRIPAAVKSASSSASAEVPVDVLAGAPDRYLGHVTVSGSVTSVDAAHHTFVLGCADACVAVPVQYSGSPLKPGSEVLVIGTISKKAGGQFAFAASDVRTR